MTQVENPQSVSYKHVMVAIDGSSHSLQAMYHGAGIALSFGGKLSLVHVVAEEDSNAFELDDDGEAPKDLETRKAHGQQILDGALQKLPDALRSSCESHLETGTAAGAILALSETVGADLLVLGGRGLSGFRRFLLGSVSYAVSRRATGPVLIIHD
jgi:nucleotide-binding universal stress UspA family protein